MSWDFRFRRNVHMYCHELKCKSGNIEFNCQTEDSAQESKVVMFWIDDLPLSESQLSVFSQSLEEWARRQDFKFRIYLGNECLAARLS